MTITPDQARELLDGATPGPWDASFDDEADATRLYPWGEDEEIEDRDSWELARRAPDLAQTIAGMTWQHAVEVYNADAKCWIQGSEWISNREVAEQDIDAYSRAYCGAPTRLVRRLVGPVEVTE